MVILLNRIHPSPRASSLFREIHKGKGSPVYLQNTGFHGKAFSLEKITEEEYTSEVSEKMTDLVTVLCWYFLISFSESSPD